MEVILKSHKKSTALTNLVEGSCFLDDDKQLHIILRMDNYYVYAFNFVDEFVHKINIHREVLPVSYDELSVTVDLD